MIICDEPVSALDVSVQAQVLNLLEDLKVKYGLTLIFIAHDLAVVKNVSDRVAVMYLGKMCEVAQSDDLYARAAHPYTNVLMQSIPEPDPFADHSVADLVGELPSPVNPPSGCRFHTRCPNADALCQQEEPILRSMGEGHFVACHHPGRDRRDDHGSCHRHRPEAVVRRCGTPAGASRGMPSSPHDGRRSRWP